jgi:hypothetical protein
MAVRFNTTTERNLQSRLEGESRNSLRGGEMEGLAIAAAVAGAGADAGAGVAADAGGVASASVFQSRQTGQFFSQSSSRARVFFGRSSSTLVATRERQRDGAEEAKGRAEPGEQAEQAAQAAHTNQGNAGINTQTPQAPAWPQAPPALPAPSKHDGAPSAAGSAPEGTPGSTVRTVLALTHTEL